MSHKVVIADPLGPEGIEILRTDASLVIEELPAGLAPVEIHRRVRDAAGLIVRGRLERSPEGVVNIIAEHLEPLRLAASSPSRDFR